MAEPLTETTIDDLPYEMLEKLIPDLKPKTISTLKLVNWRFYQLLSYDRYYMPYLHYPEKYYLCELNNERNSGEEVIKEIKNGTIGKWKGYLTLENLHLDNLRCGRITRCEIVPLRPPLFDESQYDMTRKSRICRGRIDEYGEHWLVVSSLDGHMNLINITNEPKISVQQEIPTTTTCVIMLPGQVICVSWQLPIPHIAVLNIVNAGGEISLQRNFDFEIIDKEVQWKVASAKCESPRNRRNLFVTVSRNFNDGLLHFRDLSNGKVLEDVRLWDYDCLKRFIGTPGPGSNWVYSELYGNYNEDSPFTAIRVAFLDFARRGTLLVFYNVEFMKATSFVHMPTGCVNDVCITGNVAYIFSYPSPARVRFDHTIYSVDVHIHPLKERGNVGELNVPKFCYIISNLRTRIRFFLEYQLLSLHGKLFFCYANICDNTAVRIIRINESEVYDVQVTLAGIDCCKAFFSMIGYDILVVETLEKDEPVKMFKINRKEDGAVAEELFDSNKTLSDYKIAFSRTRSVLEKDLSKLILYDRDFRGNDQLVVFHF